MASTPNLLVNDSLGPIAALLLNRRREQLEALAEAVLSVLDLIDGDPDLEPDGDEQDGSMAEDDFRQPVPDPADGPGCPISDPDLEHDGREPHAYNEDVSSDLEGYRFHVRRIRASRCVPRIEQYRDWYSRQIVRRKVGHRLVREPTVPTKRQLLTRKRGMPKRPRA